MVAAMLLFPHQLRVFFLLCLPAPFYSRTTLPHLAILRLCLVFGVLTIDFGEDIFNARVGVRVDEMAEQIGEA
jgi:hypothetical protein